MPTDMKGKPMDMLMDPFQISRIQSMDWKSFSIEDLVKNIEEEIKEVEMETSRHWIAFSSQDSKSRTHVMGSCLAMQASIDKMLKKSREHKTQMEDANTSIQNIETVNVQLDTQASNQQKVHWALQKMITVRKTCRNILKLMILFLGHSTASFHSIDS